MNQNGGFIIAIIACLIGGWALWEEIESNRAEAIDRIRQECTASIDQANQECQAKLVLAEKQKENALEAQRIDYERQLNQIDERHQLAIDTLNNKIAGERMALEVQKAGLETQKRDYETKVKDLTEREIQLQEQSMRIKSQLPELIDLRDKLQPIRDSFGKAFSATTEQMKGLDELIADLEQSRVEPTKPLIPANQNSHNKPIVPQFQIQEVISKQLSKLCYKVVPVGDSTSDLWYDKDQHVVTATVRGQKEGELAGFKIFRNPFADEAAPIDLKDFQGLRINYRYPAGRESIAYQIQFFGLRRAHYEPNSVARRSEQSDDLI